MNNQPNDLISKSKLLEWIKDNKHHYFDAPEVLEAIEDMVDSGGFDPELIPLPSIKPGDKVRHSDLGEIEITSDPIVGVSKGENYYHVYLRDLEVIE